MPRPGFQPSDLVGAPVQTTQGQGIVRAIINNPTATTSVDNASVGDQAALLAAELLFAVELTQNAGDPVATSSVTPVVSVVDESISNSSSSRGTAAATVIHVTSEQMFTHSICAIGTPVLSVFGTGVLVAYRAKDDAHVVRLWQPRGTASALGYLRRDAMLRPLPAAVGIRVKTPDGDGVVVGFKNGQCLQGDPDDDVFLVRVDSRSKPVFVPGKHVSSPVAKVTVNRMFRPLSPLVCCVTCVSPVLHICQFAVMRNNANSVRLSGTCTICLL